MFWDKVAGVYDIFTNIINRKTHQTLCAVIADLIRPTDEVLECACGTGMLSGVIARKCKSLIATDFSLPMLKRAEKKCARYRNVTFQQGNILQIDFAAERFDVVVAANVIHLLEEPYMNENEKGETNAITAQIGKAGADFKREFTLASYQKFFADEGYQNVTYTWCDGKVPCAVAVIIK